MIVLALTTSTPIASVAIVEDGRALAEIAHGDPRGHAERLFDLVDQALAAAGRSRAGVRLVACDVGPGSFTGVRIGVASAKGVAEGLGVPLCGVVSLEAMAAQARADAPPGALVASAIDAKKGELYVAVYDGERALLAPAHVPRELAAERVLAAAAGRPLVTIVDVDEIAAFAPSAQSAPSAPSAPSAQLAPSAPSARALVAPPSAAWIARLASARFAAHVAAGGAIAPAFDPAEVAPLYVRAPDAIPQISGPSAAFDMLPPR